MNMLPTPSIEHVARLSITVAVLLCIEPSPAAAQSDIRIRAVRLADASPTQFVATRDIRLQVARGVLDGLRFQVRVFRGTRDQLARSGRALPGGRCVEYDTTVYTGVSYRAGQVFVAQTDRSWLTPGPQKYDPAVFTLVFESGAPDTARIAIARDDLRSYFDRGIEIEVQPDDYVPTLVAREAAEHRQQYERYAARLTAAQGCFRLVPEPGGVATLLESCESDSTLVADGEPTMVMTPVSLERAGAP